MGRASNRKKEKRKERVAEARKLRIVVCAYPDKTLLPVVELLKAAAVYGDEVVLHHPTATMLASVAAVAELGSAEFVDVMRAFAPALGEKGASFEQAMTKLEADHGRESLRPLLSALLDPTSMLHRVLPTVAGAEAASLADSAREFGQLRGELDAVIEQQLDEAGVGQLMPAIDAGLLRLAPMDDDEDFLESYISALWSVLKDRQYYPLLDAGIADLVAAAVREGMFEPSREARLRGRQAGAASQFLARLPTFPRATMDEIVDIRSELAEPLVRFRAEMVRVSRDLGVDAYDPAFEDAAEQAWIENVHPALLELEEMVEERRLRHQFGIHLPTSGVVGAAGGLVAGVITQTPMTGSAFAVGAGAAVAGAAAMHERAQLDRDMLKRPYFLLHRTEELLAPGDQ